MTARLKGVEAQARRLAQKQGQTPGTAHVLRVLMATDPHAERILRQHGLGESGLIRAFAALPDEPQSALELALTRAERLSAAGTLARGEPLHLLAVIARDTRSAAHRMLTQLGLEPLRVAADVDGVLGIGTAVGETQRADEARARTDARSSAARGAGRWQQRQGQHALASRTEQNLAQARREGRALPPTVSPEPAPAAVQARPQAHPARVAVCAAAAAVTSAGIAEVTLDPQRFKLLTALGRNLSVEARAGRLDPVIGREFEVEQLRDVLARRRANNPVLVGPPGVGKTAVVEGLALALAAEAGSDRILIELSAGRLIAGTGVRGALAERLQQLREEVARGEGRITLFIDEIHVLIGEGDGPDSLANELKSALARGELPCIGATTDREYAQVFERDAALARRFTRIEVTEPDPEIALDLLQGVSLEYARHHAVAYTDEALRQAVELSVRYLPERHLPDKAIGVIDLAGARVARRGGHVVDCEDVADVIAEHAGVPAERLLMRDGEALLALEAELSSRVIGQGEATRAVAASLRKSAAGFHGRRPLGTFMFLGPTGVGKTELARAVADVLFPGVPMTRLDMAEFGEAHNVARLLGAPPGYVGHEEGGQLTEPVRRRPYQLVLLDEIEKAHPDVLLALLGLLDEGRLTDGRGRTVDFTNTVVVLTSNLGAEVTRQKPRIGFSRAGANPERELRRDAALAAARAALPPELWNRIDEPLYFQPLELDDVARIAERMLEEIVQVIAVQHAIELSVEASVIDTLVACGGHDPQLGARPMRRVLGRLVEAHLADAVLAGEIGPGDRVRLVGEERGVRIVREASVGSQPADAAE